MPQTRFTLDPGLLKGLDETAKRRLDTTTEGSLQANAVADADNPPLSDEELERLGGARLIQRARKSTGLSQAGFADRYRISLGRLRDLEQGRSFDRTMVAYCALILDDPEVSAAVIARTFDAHAA